MMYYCTAYDHSNAPIMGTYVAGISNDEVLEEFDWLLYHHYADVFEKTAYTLAREAEHDEEV